MNDVATPSKKSALDLLSKRVSLVTSLVAILAAFSGIFASRCTTRGQVYKNDTIQTQEAVTNEWNFFQSRNFRIEIAELGRLFLAQSPRDSEHIKTDRGLLDRQIELRNEKLISKAKARDLEERRDQLDAVSALYFDLGKYFASALVIFQVALMLVPIVLITRQEKLLNYSVILSLGGIAVLVVSFAKYFAILAQSMPNL